MDKKSFDIEEIEKMAEKSHKGVIIKKLKINYDSKNYFVRIPKEIEEFAKIKKGDQILMEVDTNEPSEEVIITCKVKKS